MNRVAAFFDLDGTLFRGYLWGGITKYHLLHRKKLPVLLSYLATHLPLVPLKELGLLSEERFLRSWATDLAVMMGGLNQEEVKALFHWVTERYAVDSFRPDIVAALRQHQDRGDTVVLLSATFQELLELIGYRLGVVHVVGTKLEMVRNKYTGRIVKPLCFGAGKAKLLQDFIDSAKLEVDLASSFAYADSIHDVPVLEMVGNPVVVYPDERLWVYARKKGWRILEGKSQR